MKTLARILAAALLGFAVWTCTESVPDKPDTLTLILNDSLKTSALKYDSIKIDLYTVRGTDTVYAKTLFHGAYVDASQLVNLNLGFLADGNFSLKLLGFRDGVKVLELGLGFSGGDPGLPQVVAITPPDTPEVIITWPLIGHVTNQDSIVVQWGVDSAQTGLVVKPPMVFQLDEGEMPLTLLDTNGRGIVGSATIHVTRVAGVLFVNAAATDSGDGNSWATAYRNLQTALARATDGWDIWVSKGMYGPLEGTGLDSAYDTSFAMKAGGDLFGGFAGTEGARDLRDWNLNETVLSGERGDTVITDNAGPVLLGANNATLDGFVVERGFTQTHMAAGMVNSGASPQISNCIFRENVSRNPARGTAGISNESSNSNILNCTFRNNSSDDAGVILNIGGSPTITGSIFQANTGGNSGAIENTGLSTAVIISCLFAYNRSANGAAITNTMTTSTILNSVFLGNSSGFLGGAVFAGGSAVIKNSLFIENTSVKGGAIFSFSPLNITNCTFFSNNATDSGGAIYYGSQGLVTTNSIVRNSILWGNFSPAGSEIATSIDSLSSDTIEINYSDVYIGNNSYQIPGTFFLKLGQGYFNSPPLFKNTANYPGIDGVFFTVDDGLSLLGSSPCVNSGDPVSTGTANPEITGAARIQGSGIDIGAYEQ